ncbi:thioredoxin-like domain-containing protein [Bacteroidota bacterium]
MRASRNGFLVTLLTLFILPSISNAQGYGIKVIAPDFAGQNVILAEYFTNRMIPKDTAEISITGEAMLTGSKPFEGGLYVVYFNSQYYFDMILDRNQFFTVRVDSSNLVGKTVFENSYENSEFYKYKSYLNKQRNRHEDLLEQLANAKDISDTTWIQKKIDELNEEIDIIIKSIIAENKYLFLSVFLEAMQDRQAPEVILKGTQREKDSIRYTYYKDHYFDNFNVSDIRLLHTPLYDPKIKNYINKVVPQHPDSIIVAVDYLIEKSRAHKDIFRYMLITLFNNYAESKIMGMDKVYFHIAEKYYIPEATWSDQEFVDNLKENLEKSKPTFIGNTAPDFELKGIPGEHFQLAAMDTAIKRDHTAGYSFLLSEIPATYTILYFWEADCGHCQKATPILYEVFEKYKDKGVKVIAVHVINSIEGKEKWVDFVNEKGMYDWINSWSPYDNDFRKQYNLLSFPQLFILDENKKIVAKGLAPEQADDFLDRNLDK